MSALLRLRQEGWLLAWPLLLAPLIWLVFDRIPLDRVAIAPFFDAHSHSFPWRHHPFMQNIMHSGLKFMVVAVGMALLGGFLLTYIVPQWETHRRRLLWLFLAMSGGTLLVSVLKQGSALHCPWDLAEYGGYAPFARLFERLPDAVAAGRCFPGGHASGGFALMAFYFGLRDTHPRHARLGLALGLGLGMAMGWAQMMRGAHFLSHNVWAAWVVWMFLALFYIACPPQCALLRR